ncbi:hypothetical protein [Arthrobacter sp. NPDC090010]|uniref:hypothetical protein n=1 Tax=Arthrobacter sp. NPDC090010 TaxID=3363942 RepID=UPI0037FBA802
MTHDNGLSIPAWTGRRRAEALARVKADGVKRRLPCVICDQRIDYGLVYPHPYSCSVQHLRSQARFPALRWEPSNWAPAHLECNQSAGVNAPEDLGVMSNDW